MNKITVTKKELKQVTVELAPGQIYRMIDDPSRVYMIVNLYDGYALIKLNDGVAWDNIVEDIDDLFGSEYNDFELLKDAELNIII